MGELEDTTNYETAWLQRAVRHLPKLREDVQQWFETSDIII
jgi:hypothetical protein